MEKSTVSFFGRMRRLIFTSAAHSSQTTERVQAVQLERALRHLPMIYAVATLNIILIMTLCFQRGMPVANFAWMSAVAGFCVIRMIQWISRSRSPKPLENPQRMLRSLTVVSVTLISALSGWSVYALSSDMFADVALIPVSLAFGSTCIAHCLAPIKRAAVGVLLVGIVPVASFMILWGDFESLMIGVSMLTIAVLMAIFIVESYEQIIDGIVMEQKILSHANSDALTGIANRRAIMAALVDIDARDDDSETTYAVALLDLDGFKQINDTHGHHVGDALLKVVAERLESTAEPSEFIGRLGGDEFFVLMDELQDGNMASARVTAFLSALCQPAEIEGLSLPLSGSMGFAVHSRDGNTSKELMRAADEALYAEKDNRDALVDSVSELNRDAA